MFPLTYICVPAQNMFSEGLGANLSLSPKSVKTCSVVEHRCPAAKLTRNTGPHVCEPGCALIYAQIKMNFVSQLIGRATSSGSSGAAPSSSSSSSSSSLSNHEHSLRVADSVVGNKVIANTKDGYRSKWNTFKQFLLSNNPLLLNDENEVTIFDRFDNNLLTGG